LADKVIGVGHLGRPDDVVVRGVQAPITDILHHRVREQKGVLQHQPKPAAQLGFGDLADVHAVDADRPAVDLIEAGQQIDDGRFSGPGRADQGDGLAGPGLERHVPDHRRVAAVAEGHMFEADLPAHGHSPHGSRRGIDLRRGIHDLEDPLGPGQGGL
jgi:hypothetical protein